MLGLVGCSGNTSNDGGPETSRTGTPDTREDAAVDGGDRIIDTEMDGTDAVSDVSDNGDAIPSDSTSSDDIDALRDGHTGEIDSSDATDTNLSARAAPGIHPLVPPRFDQPPGRLTKLEQIVGESNIVGLGQAMPYSQGFSRVRARVIKYMVEEMGFRTIAFGGGWKTAPTVNEYLVDGDHSVQRAARAMLHPTWRDTPTIQLLKWLRKWNTRHGNDPVQLFAFASWSPPLYGNEIRRLAKTMKDDELSTLSSEIDACIGAKYTSRRAWVQNRTSLKIAQGMKTLPKTRYEACKNTLKKLETWRKKHRSSLKKKLERRRATFVRAAITSLQGTNEYYYQLTRDETKATAVRDRLQAEIFKRLRPLYGKQKRVVIFHFNRWLLEKSDALSKTKRPNSFGSRLAARYGDGYVSIGLYAKTVRWKPPGKTLKEWKATSTDAIETKLAQYGEDALLVDLEKATGTNKTFRPGMSYEMGLKPMLEGSPAAHWDGLFYSKVSRPIP